MNYYEHYCKSIIAPSKLPGSDFVINPYIGCEHGCRYCYARFMQRFSNHAEPWGEFVDTKQNAVEMLPKNPLKFLGRTITIGSVTDPYQTIEAKKQLTRRLLEKLVSFDSRFFIITKSPLITRDIDLLRQFKDITLMLSAGFDQESVKEIFEPRTPPILARIGALKELKENNLKVILFISPILPYLTRWENLVAFAAEFIDEVWFENLNLYASIRNHIFYGLSRIDKALIKKYQQIYAAPNNYWNDMGMEIKRHCQQRGISYRLCFHHEASG